jgi:heavy metal sensor kinase
VSRHLATLGRASSGLRTIRARLTLWYLAILALTLLAFSAFLYLNLSRVLRSNHDQDLLQESSEVSAALEEHKPPGKLSTLASTPDSDAMVVIYDASGERILAANDESPPLAPGGALSQAAHGETVYGVLPKPGGSWRTLTLPVMENGEIVAILSLARPRDSIDATLGGFGETLLVAVPLTLLLALAGGLFLASRALSPIDRVTRAAERFSGSDFSPRLNLPGPPDEVVRLAATFDRMLGRIEKAFLRERQFTADASHELRTPLALLMIRADLALQRPRNADDYRDALAQIRQDAMGMSRLLNDLLLLARADAGREPLTLEPLALNDIVPDIVAGMLPLAEARGVQLNCLGKQSITVEADQTKLTQLVVNLMDNALKFTPAGGSISVVLRRRDPWAEIEVSDTGMGIPAQHRAHVFERFYRVDEARSRAEGGTGLGLTICRWIAKAHGGDISIESREGEGSKFTVRLPASHRKTANPGIELAVRTA